MLRRKHQKFRHNFLFFRCLKYLELDIDFKRTATLKTINGIEKSFKRQSTIPNLSNSKNKNVSFVFHTEQGVGLLWMISLYLKIILDIVQGDTKVLEQLKLPLNIVSLYLLTAFEFLENSGKETIDESLSPFLVKEKKIKTNDFVGCLYALVAYKIGTFTVPEYMYIVIKKPPTPDLELRAIPKITGSSIPDPSTIPMKSETERARREAEYAVNFDNIGHKIGKNSSWRESDIEVEETVPKSKLHAYLIELAGLETKSVMQNDTLDDLRNVIQDCFQRTQQESCLKTYIEDQDTTYKMFLDKSFDPLILSVQYIFDFLDGISFHIGSEFIRCNKLKTFTEYVFILIF